MTACPKCGFAVGDPGQEACLKCGVIFARVSTGPRPKTRSQMFVTTGDWPKPYAVVRPVLAYVTDQGGMLFEQAKRLRVEDTSAGVGRQFAEAVLLGAATVQHERIPAAFAVCVELLRERALALNADGVIAMRFDMDASQAILSQKIYAQAYGTAIVVLPETS